MKTGCPINIFFAADAAETARQFQENLAQRQARASIWPMDRLRSTFATTPGVAILNAILWSQQASLDPTRRLIESINFGGHEIWIVFIEGTAFSELPASLRFCRHVRVRKPSGTDFMEACERLASLAQIRERATKPASRGDLRRMIVERSIRVRIPGPPSSQTCNVATILGLAPLAAPSTASTFPSRGGAPYERSGTPPLPLPKALARITEQSTALPIDRTARLWGYWLGMGGISAAAFAWREQISEAILTLIGAKYGWTWLPPLLFRNSTETQTSVFFAVSSEPLFEGRTTIHVDLLSNNELPATVQVQGSKAPVAVDKPVGTALCPIRKGETIVVALVGGDGLTVCSDHIQDHCWSGSHFHMQFDVAVPPGCSRTNFKPELVIRTGRCEEVLLCLEIGPHLNVLRRLISDIASGLSGNIFVSYTRRSELDKLIAQANKRHWESILGLEAFRDVDSIPNSDPWRPTIESALSNTILFVLIWSWAASGSDEVRKEIAAACKMKDAGQRLEFDIVGVANNEGKCAPLPDCLAQYQMRYHPVRSL